MNTPSPCIRVCRLDPDGLCPGCFRTGDEIARWSRIADEERIKIMACLDGRREMAQQSRAEHES